MINGMFMLWDAYCRCSRSRAGKSPIVLSFIRVFPLVPSSPSCHCEGCETCEVLVLASGIQAVE